MATTITPRPTATPLEAIAGRKRLAAERLDRQAAEYRRQAEELEVEARRRRAALAKVRL